MTQQHKLNSQVINTSLWYTRVTMDKAVAQALESLIPELNSPLPQELLELAISLLAQSRNKASNLKAEEEIARSYACAHLACERFASLSKQH